MAGGKILTSTKTNLTTTDLSNKNTKKKYRNSDPGINQKKMLEVETEAVM